MLVMKKHGLVYHIVFFPFLLFKYGIILGEAFLKFSIGFAFKFTFYYMPLFAFSLVKAIIPKLRLSAPYIQKMDGHGYEYACADMLKKRGYSRVTVTKASGDQGIDIIAYKNGKKYGIQCKYYSSPVGNKAIQETYAGIKYYNCDIGAVMTNNTFTASAKKLATKTGILLWDNNNVSCIPHASSKFVLFIACMVALIIAYSYIGLIPFFIIGIIVLLLFIIFKRTPAVSQPKEQFQDSTMTDSEALLYGAMCEKYAKEKDYIESMGILNEAQNVNSPPSKHISISSEETQPSKEDILFYAKKCEKYAQEKDYMDKLGILSDDKL